MFDKVLIADRGEIVVRIARTCERLGIATVAVYTDEDAQAPHASSCDQALRIGATAEAYRDRAALIATAQQAGAQALHPGYGALARDAELAHAAEQAGLRLIAAAPEALAQFTDRLRGRELARMAGVRALPSLPLEAAWLHDFAQVAQRASEVGYPLRVRSAAGRTLGLVESDDELAAAVSALQAEITAGADPQPLGYLEHWVEHARLLTLQLASDGRDQVALADVERSLLVLDESPAPALTALTSRNLKRRTLCDAALRIAREGGLTGLASAEFLLDTQGRLFFDCMQPGLPEAHVIAEMCCKIDLVEIQLQLAAGERLPAEARRAQPTGHAVQAQISAQHAGEAAPDPVELSGWRWPTVAPGCLRVESAFVLGSRVALQNGAGLAKVVAFGQTRHQALLTLDRVLAEATIEPTPTNLGFVREMLADESFRAGQYDVGFPARLRAELKTHT